MSTRRQSIPRKAAFSGAALLLAAIFLEIVSRILIWTAFPAPEVAPDQAPRTFGDMDFNNPYLPFVRHSKGIGFLSKRESENGEPVPPQKADNEIRILCWGASTTVDQPEYAKSWPGLLEKKLTAAYPDQKIVVLVQAHGAYFTSDNLVFYVLRSQDYHPDLIIVYDGWNDLIPSETPGFLPDYSHSRGKPVVPSTNPFLAGVRSIKNRLPWVEHFGTFQLTLRLAERMQSKAYNFSLYKADGHPLKGYHGIDTFRRNIETVARLGVQNGSKVVLASQIAQTGPPFLGDRDSRLDMTALREHNRALQLIGTTFDGCRFFDIASAYPQDKRLFTDRIHFSPEGSEVVASLFFDFLTKKNDLIQRWNKNNYRRTAIFPFGDLDQAAAIGSWPSGWPPSMVGLHEGDVVSAAILAPLLPPSAGELGLRIPMGFLPRGTYRLQLGVAYDPEGYDSSRSKNGGVAFRANLQQGDADTVIAEHALDSNRPQGPSIFVDVEHEFTASDGPAVLALTWKAVGGESNPRVALRYPIIRLVE